MRGLERFFRLLAVLSLGGWVRRPFDDGTPHGRWKAANAIDLYVCAWLALEIVLYLVAGSVASWLLLAVVLYRLAEIVQVYSNTLIFDELRHPTRVRGPYTVLSVGRNLVLMVILLVETMLLYGLAFYVARADISGIGTPADALYLSIGTISTGPTEATPHGWIRFVVASEVLFGFLFVVTILGRVVSLLARIRDLTQPGSPEPEPEARSARAERRPLTDSLEDTPARQQPAIAETPSSEIRLTWRFRRSTRRDGKQ